MTALTSNPDGPPIASVFLRAQRKAKFGKAQQQHIFTGAIREHGHLPHKAPIPTRDVRWARPPRLSTYVNIRKWFMAQRALTPERPTNTAQAVAGGGPGQYRLHLPDIVLGGQPGSPYWGNHPCRTPERHLQVRSGLSARCASRRHVANVV